ncbi:IclR family transcriptional regulator [Sphaerisporangium fuscum]|uniref:IclR family transcriptional regulator n=1 Tax=Sphaerisporangium fuscum TaxID=2835868 RepID=UPI001BDCACDE|nr:IclR family transcriptional regulator [Sphaerisporangium fuscum]
MSNEGERDSTGVQSVDRALSVLKLLARHGELGVSEIAAELGVHRSTAFRLVATLENHDLVHQNDERGRYRLGVGVLRLAGATTARLDVVQEGRRIGTRLAAEIGETVNIAILDRRQALYVDQMAGTSALQAHNWTGRRIALHATSNGKVLLAHAPDERFEEVVAEPLPRFTDHTITDPALLREELDGVLRQGYATAVDELEVGLTAVAAPIRGADGTVAASLSVSGPTFRLPADRLATVAAQAVTAATEISSRLGWYGSL